jgi:methylmalonyl-CoA mutase cobalamin-binding subunit
VPAHATQSSARASEFKALTRKRPRYLDVDLGLQDRHDPLGAKFAPIPLHDLNAQIDE